MIVRGDIYTPTKVIPNGDVRIEGPEITAISSRPLLPYPKEEFFDFSGHIVAPGFINLHVHGGAGSDTMDATESAITTLALAQLRQGVTTFLPTTVSAPQATLQRVFSQLHSILSPHRQGAQIAGIHAEGPFISPKKRGAHAESAILDYLDHNPVDVLEEFITLAGGKIRLLSLAPEYPQAEALIRCARAHNIVVSLGHSTSTFDQAREAIEWGARHATHTFNAMPPLHHRQPGLVTAVMLDDRVYTELIADAVHLHPAICQLLLQVKGEERIILITDAVRCAGMEDGEYLLGDLPITKHGEHVYLRDQVGHTLAGSILTMNRGVKLLVTRGGYTLQQALKAASTNPAHVLGLQHCKGSLEPGKDADFVVLDTDFKVKAVFIKGTFQREACQFLSKPIRCRKNFHTR